MAVTRTPVISNPGVVPVSPVSKGESLHFTLKTSGPRPIFSFAGTRGEVFGSDDLSPSAGTFKWDHLRNPSDIQQLELLDLTLLFLSNASYEYIVETRNKKGKTLKKVLHVKYSGSGTDHTSESFRVAIV